MLLGLLFVGLALTCGITGARWIHTPFPGFFVLANRVVASISLPHWSVAAHGEIYQNVIVAVNAQPVASSDDVYTAVQRLPVGSPITYTLEKDGQTSQMTLSSQLFELPDYLLLFGGYLFTGLMVAFIGIGVWFLQPASPASRALLVGTGSLGLFFLTAIDLYFPHWFFRVHVMSEVLFPAGFAHLALIFPVDRFRRFRSSLIALPYILALTLGTLYETVLFQPAAYSWIHGLCEKYIGLATVALLLSATWDYWSTESALIRQRIRVIVLGFCGFALPGLLSFLSSLNGGEVAVNYGTFTVFVFPLSLGYAIVKHDLFEIDTLLKRSVSYLTLTMLLTVSYLGLVAVVNRFVQSTALTQSPLFMLFLTAAIVLLLNPLKDAVQRILDRLFFRLSYNPQEVLDTASTFLASTLRLEKIVGYLWNTIRDNLGIQQGAIYLRAPDGHGFTVVYPDDCISSHRLHLSAAHPLLQTMQQQKGRAFSEYHMGAASFSDNVRAAVQHEFERLHASVFVPLMFQGEPLGIIVLGRKESGTRFSAADLDFLSLLAKQGVLALSNALTYQALKELNVGLEQKVGERTQALACANRQLEQTNTQLHTSVKQLEQANRDLKSSQAQLVRAEKMAAFGRLTAGVAHEINTPLGASMTSLKLIQQLTQEYRASIGEPQVTAEDHYEIADEMDQYVSDTYTWLEKAAGYIQSLKVHSRSLQRGEECDFSLRQVLEDTIRLLSHQLRLSKCQVTMKGVRPQLMLHGDPGKLGQVFTNLIINAIDAYKDTPQGGGDIHIEVEDNAETILIQVHDQAGGIAPEHYEHIFEEFFSTKLQGQGTGLGLAICRNIITDFFNGSLTVESQAGQGSTFILQLPRKWSGRTEASLGSGVSHPIDLPQASLRAVHQERAERLIRATREKERGLRLDIKQEEALIISGPERHT